MKDNNIALSEAFLSLGIPVDISKVNTWSMSDVNAYPPYFRFKFKGLDKTNGIYLLIKKNIEEFKGALEWTVITREDVSSYVVLPKIFAENWSAGKPFRKEYFLNIFSELEYSQMIDKAIDDIPHLAEAIKRIKPS